MPSLPEPPGPPSDTWLEDVKSLTAAARGPINQEIVEMTTSQNPVGSSAQLDLRHEMEDNSQINGDVPTGPRDPTSLGNECGRKGPFRRTQKHPSIAEDRTQ